MSEAVGTTDVKGPEVREASADTVQPNVMEDIKEESNEAAQIDSSASSSTKPDGEPNTQANPAGQHPKRSATLNTTTGTPTLRRQPSSIIPDNKIADEAAARATEAHKHASKSVMATTSFDDAVSNCQKKVEKIVKMCRMENKKYRDSHFDLTLHGRYCLDGLLEGTGLTSMGVARVEDIFDEPMFFKGEGATAGDVRQGSDGDCWFLAAISTVTNVKGLLEKVCVARDEKIGVYGFVFMRDGDWISVVVDDQLYLNRPEFHDSPFWQSVYDGKESEYKKTLLSGSSALQFAKCQDPNETWLPLLEKAYAKAHGDYSALDGGWTGEAVEDLTGGVTSEIFTTDILDRDQFWKEELLEVNKEYLFAAWIWHPYGDSEGDRQGVFRGHAYSVLRAVEVDKQRFLLIRNPWGKSEWTGPWSDGSKEWTPEMMKALGHRFGDDGVFWMSYRDFLRRFTICDRTRLFDSNLWTVTDRWLRVAVPWSDVYFGLRFVIKVTKQTPAVIVLSQIDSRYFRGLEGRYTFFLEFRLHKESEDDYIKKSRANVTMNRSVSAEIDLEPGNYTVLFKVDTDYDAERKKSKDIVKAHKNKNRRKFLQMAMAQDIAFAKAGIIEPEKPKVKESNVKDSKVGPEKDGSEEGDAGEKDPKKDESEEGDAGEKDPKKDERETETKPEKPETEKQESEDSVKTESKAGGSDKEAKPLDWDRTPVPNEEGKLPPRELVFKEEIFSSPEGSRIPTPDTSPLPSPRKAHSHSRNRSVASAHPGRSSIASSYCSSRTPPPPMDLQLIRGGYPPQPLPLPFLDLPAPIPLAPPPKPDEDDEVWEPEAVIGLRVYSQDKDLTVDLELPKQEMPEDRPDIDDTTRNVAGMKEEGVQTEAEDSKDSKDPKYGDGPNEYSAELKGEKVSEDSKDPKDPKDSTESKDLVDLKDSKEVKDSSDPKKFEAPVGSNDVSETGTQTSQTEPDKNKGSTAEPPKKDTVEHSLKEPTVFEVNPSDSKSSQGTVPKEADCAAKSEAKSNITDAKEVVGTSVTEKSQEGESPSLEKAKEQTDSSKGSKEEQQSSGSPKLKDVEIVSTVETSEKVPKTEAAEPLVSGRHAVYEEQKKGASADQLPEKEEREGKKDSSEPPIAVLPHLRSSRPANSSTSSVVSRSSSPTLSAGSRTRPSQGSKVKRFMRNLSQVGGRTTQ